MSSRNSGPSKEAQRVFGGGKSAEPVDRDAAFAREQARQRQAVDEKTNRLRALRLAKEAADREAAFNSTKAYMTGWGWSLAARIGIGILMLGLWLLWALL